MGPLWQVSTVAFRVSQGVRARPRLRRRCSVESWLKPIGSRRRRRSYWNRCRAIVVATGQRTTETTSIVTWIGMRTREGCAKTLRWMRMPCISRGRKFQRSRRQSTENTRDEGDRKSTRLNSSHHSISYAVFCLKKKKKKYSSIVTKPNQITKEKLKLKKREI